MHEWNVSGGMRSADPDQEIEKRLEIVTPLKLWKAKCALATS